MKSEQPQPQRMQQTMPEDGDGWHQVNAGPHLHIMFHPNRQLLGREADGIERPSIVVAVAGKREQALRFDPFSVGSHYHIRPSLRGKQLPLWVEEGQKPLEIALAFFEKPSGHAIWLSAVGVKFPFSMSAVGIEEVSEPALPVFCWNRS